MKDTVFELYDKCPKCGKSKGLYYNIQYPLEVMQNLNGKTFIKPNGKRVTRISNRRKAFMFDQAQVDFQVANCVCEFCGWESEPITQ